jgi:predicted dehydrogenase
VRTSLIAGKSVFLEWPLDRNLPTAREMLSLSKTNGSKTIVGLQGSFSPVIRKMKEMVGSGKFGKVLGSTIMARLGNGDTTERKNVRYFLEREVGGNVVSIHLGHSLDFIASGPYLHTLAQELLLEIEIGS